jgi:hypothetical protein
MDITFESYIAGGIPCTVRVDNVVHQEPCRHTWDSADDFYGFTEVEFTLLTSSGRESKALLRRATAADLERIEGEAIEWALSDAPTPKRAARMPVVELASGDVPW